MRKKPAASAGGKPKARMETDDEDDMFNTDSAVRTPLSWPRHWPVFLAVLIARLFSFQIGAFDFDG